MARLLRFEDETEGNTEERKTEVRLDSFLLEHDCPHEGLLKAPFARKEFTVTVRASEGGERDGKDFSCCESDCRDRRVPECRTKGTHLLRLT